MADLGPVGSAYWARFGTAYWAKGDLCYRLLGQTELKSPFFCWQEERCQRAEGAILCFLGDYRGTAASTSPVAAAMVVSRLSMSSSQACSSITSGGAMRSQSP
jgi:hypothetical protein